MVKKWNRPRTIGVLPTAFLAGWGVRLALPVPPT
jgi:hypothetical protein